MVERETYVSVFHINGEPILPPLMTMEKRLEMQMYREKAVQLESKLQRKRVQFNEGSLVGSPRSASDVHSDNTSQVSSDVRPSESEIEECCEELSPKILVNTACNTESKPSREFGTNTPKIVGELSLAERTSMLGKSGPIGFDLVANTVITALSASEKAAAQKQEENKRTNVEALRELVEKINLERSHSKKTLHLPLAIPSICVDPPTPITDVQKIGDMLSGTESVESFDVSGFQSTQDSHNQVTELLEESTDESCCTQSTEHIAQLTPLKKIPSITARTFRFEQEDCNNASFEDEQYFSSRTPKRSATSPSLKSLGGERPVHSLTSSPRTEDTSATSLVRSSSFTLDGPSKALIDHMQKQYNQAVDRSHSATNSSKSAAGSKSENRSNSAPSASRDTVESKAKRVQKKLDFKPSSRQSSSSRTKGKNTSFNTYPNSTAHLWNNPLPPVKVKKSPYDGKVAPTKGAKSSNAKSNNGHKHQSASGKPHKSHAPKKSNSSTTQSVRQTSQQMLPIKSTASHSSNGDITNEIESNYRQKLNILIAQQREEERRLQQMFNTQRQILLHQLNNEKFQGDNDFDNLAMLQIEGSSIARTSNMQNSNIYNTYSPSACATSDALSPTLSFSSSYVPSVQGNAFPTGDNGAYNNVPSTGSSTNTTAHSPQRSLRNANQRATNDKYNQSFGQMNQISTNHNVCDSNKLEHDSEMARKNASATLINAYARGFLVRRLFQTEQIQRIVQTIKDTLIFVLNLHMETMEDVEEANTEANIKLKARLLQQLASASRTLHLIFFQTSIKERMEIITRDRKRIKTKLLSMSLKRSPRIA